MSKSASALASLTANYTDSENEDEHESNENNSPPTEDSNESQVRSKINVINRITFRMCIAIKYCR